MGSPRAKRRAASLFVDSLCECDRATLALESVQFGHSAETRSNARKLHRLFARRAPGNVVFRVAKI